MVHPIITGLATGMGLLTDKYMLAVTNFVDHLATDLHATDFQQEFVKAAMYAGAVAGMITFGPLSDVVGRRICLIACSVITLAGAVGSTLAFSSGFLIFCRIITGIGMGGEYPLAATHSCESGDTADGGRNVALLYLFGSGFGQASCPLIVLILLKMGLPNNAVWRITFAVGALFAFIGLLLRIRVTKDSAKFENAKEARKESDIPPWAALAALPLAGTAFCWFLYDIVEYGLKQNDAAIFGTDKKPETMLTLLNGTSIPATNVILNGSFAIIGGMWQNVTVFTPPPPPYSSSVLTVFLTRLLVIPSLVMASFLPKMFPIKWMQFAGFAGTSVINLILAMNYAGLKANHIVFFDALYVVQLSFQSLPGVTTMAIPAEIFPCAYKGTAHGISAAFGKVGATLGSYFFAFLKDQDMKPAIFYTVCATSVGGALLTLAATPAYNGNTLDRMEELARAGEESRAVKVLYSGPLKAPFDEEEEEEGESSSDDTGEDA